ncbi:hypothetical protein IEQ34_011322 [Dendrobium chrysotoxum]|uniref:Secreted protein n=1 Tax=Dendrobium chrysotoxum TaxID=161865 RepID=A0AAV7GY23_DENCH|nr:hypothetical protein IEQ34_011322 [Dendrobium chrysotoxum]
MWLMTLLLTRQVLDILALTCLLSSQIEGSFQFKKFTCNYVNCILQECSTTKSVLCCVTKLVCKSRFSHLLH